MRVFVFNLATVCVCVCVCVCVYMCVCESKSWYHLVLHGCNDVCVPLILLFLFMQGGCCRTGPQDVTAIKRAISEYFKTNATT